MVLYRNPSQKWDTLSLNKEFNQRYLRVNIDQEKLSVNHKKVEKTKNLFQDEFFIICSIGRDENVEGKTSKPTRTIIPSRKNLAKIIGYNPKRKEFEEEDIEELIAELNFSIPNYVVEISNNDSPGKKDGRRREKPPKETIKNIDVPYEQKLNALKYYNSVIDKRREQYRLVSEWGLLDQDVNPMENIIMETPEELDVVNTMKIFARFNSANNHVNFMNSLLLEKNLRELIDYLKEAKERGKYDLETLRAKSNKRIFKYMSEQLSDSTQVDSEYLEIKEEGVQFSRKRRAKQNKEDLLEKLQRDSLEPSR